MDSVPDIRLRPVNERPVRRDGAFVLYWMIAARRRGWNFALQRAAEQAAELGRPLLVLEAVRCGYPWASDRLHRFLLDGMADNRRAFAGTPAAYYPYVEPSPGAGRGLLAALAEKACLVVTDDFPAFFLPRMIAAAGRKLPVRLEAVDGNGLLPLRAAEKTYPSAHLFRRLLQKELPGHLFDAPAADPLAGLPLPPGSVPEDVARRWPAADPAQVSLAALPIDHAVSPAPCRGGPETAEAILNRFLDRRLSRYAAERSQPDSRATSGLSPYLHFGHISPHHLFRRIADRQEWTPGHLAPDARGRRGGWWGLDANAEAFLDQLVTWRELGFNFCRFREDYARYESLPPWALATLERHAGDHRPRRYGHEDFEGARTHDPLWNAAQRQLVREGTIHGYLRMLWGKKILEWSASPREAAEIMIALNDRYALDGRDPNSYSGIFWCLGRYDRPWPERPVFGKVRAMSSERTAQKVGVTGYLRKYAE